MELRLTFKEKEFRDLYENSYDQLTADLNAKVKDRKRPTLILFGCAILFLLLTYLHQDWVYYAYAFFALTMSFLLWTKIMKAKTNLVIKRNRKEVEAFIKRTLDAKEIKYTYDDSTISYYESGQLKNTFEWAKVNGHETNERYLILYFEHPKTTIMIPRSMSESSEFDLFESKVSDRLKTTANKT